MYTAIIWTVYLGSDPSSKESGTGSIYEDDGETMKYLQQSSTPSTTASFSNNGQSLEFVVNSSSEKSWTLKIVNARLPKSITLAGASSHLVQSRCQGQGQVVLGWLYWGTGDQHSIRKQNSDHGDHLARSQRTFNGVQGYTFVHDCKTCFGPNTPNCRVRDWPSWLWRCLGPARWQRSDFGVRSWHVRRWPKPLWPT